MEKKKKKKKKRKGKYCVLCYNMCQQNQAQGWERRVGVEGGRSGWENERSTTILKLKKRKIKSVHFPHFLWWFGVWCGEENWKEKIDSIGSFVVYSYIVFFSHFHSVLLEKWESKRFSHPKMFYTLSHSLSHPSICICASGKSLYWKEGWLPKICVYVKPYLRDYYYSSVQCWMSGAKGILQSDIYVAVVVIPLLRYIALFERSMNY